MEELPQNPLQPVQNNLPTTVQALQQAPIPRRRGWLKILIGIIGIVILLIVCLVAVLKFLYANAEDGLPPDDKDVRMVVRHVPDSENSIFLFTKAKDVMPESKTIYTDMALGKVWDEEEAKNLIENNKEFFSYFDQALTLENFLDPNLANPETITPNTPLYSLNALRTMANLNAIRAQYLFRHGKEEEAFNEAIKIIKMGHMLQGQNINLIYYLVSVAIKNIGADQINSFVSTTTLPPDILKKYISEIESFDDNSQGLIHAWQGEYTWQLAGIEQVANELRNPTYEDPNMLNGGIPNEVPEALGGQDFYFQINNTKQTFLDVHRALIQNVSLPCNSTDIEYEGVNEDGIIPLGVRMIFTENASGKILGSIIFHSSSTAQNKKCLADFKTESAKTLLALHTFKMQNGTLPNSLDELLPIYLSELPKDPFDGSYLKYSKSGKTLSSIGADENHNQGSTNGDQFKKPTIQIEF